MADRPQTTRVSLTAAPSRGWVTLRCVPQGLTAPALVTLGACDQSESEPFARLTVGPAYPVVRAMYVPSRLPELDMQVFAPHGTVQLTFEELDGAFGLLGAMWTRLRGLRHLGPRAIAARGLGLSKRLRARNEPVGMLPLEVAATAAEWLARYHSPVSDGLAEPGSGSGRMGPGRRALLVDARGASPADLARTLTAVAHGDDPPPDVVCLRGESALPPDDLDRLRDCRLLLWLEAGEEPRAHALSCLAEAAVRAGGIAFADWIDVEAHGGERIVVTPGWDPVRAASGYTPEGGIAIMGKALSDALGHLGSTGLRTRRADLLSALATNAEPGTIAHVASPLTRVPARLQARGPASARSAMRRPFASLVIPTHARAGMLNRCIASCFDSSSYGALELVVVDHASRGPEMAEALTQIRQRPSTRVVREEGPFNYSHLINVGVSHAQGELIVLLNDDVEATSPDWLEQLVALLELPGVGIVGPRLLYPDGRIQHNGIALGMGGLAGHPGRGSWPGEPDTNRVDPWPRTVSAVTGACLVMARNLFNDIGGMDTHLAVEFNDVDLCLRAGKRGHNSALEPRVTLIHHEQATRGAATSTSPVRIADRARFVSLWGSLLAGDPWFSPNLTLEDDACGLAQPPRTPVMPRPARSRR